RRNKALFAGVIAGITVVFFRTLIDLPDADFNSSFIRHYPTFFYYLTFGTLYQFIKVKKILHRPLIVGLIGVLLDIIASLRSEERRVGKEWLFRWSTFADVKYGAN